jgi:plastocyanin
VRVVTDSAGFEPAKVTIAVGGTVTWYNPEHEVHNITSDDGLFEADISGEATYEFTFDKAGTYQYHDKDNPTRVGTIIVV